MFSLFTVNGLWTSRETAMPLILGTIQCWHISPLLRMNRLEENVTISCRYETICIHSSTKLIAWFRRINIAVQLWLSSGWRFLYFTSLHHCWFSHYSYVWVSKQINIALQLWLSSRWRFLYFASLHLRWFSHYSYVRVSKCNHCLPLKMPKSCQLPSGSTIILFKGSIHLLKKPNMGPWETSWRIIMILMMLHKELGHSFLPARKLKWLVRKQNR